MTPPKKKIAEKQLELRKALWPDLDTKLLWSRIERDGYTSIPRTMPLILAIMNGLSKGKPVSSTYLELWCRAFDEMFVTLSKHDELAFHSGFTGQRAAATWRARMKILSDLGFIKLQSGSNGDFSYALILNPYLVIKAKHERKKGSGITVAAYNALQQRAIDIGADDLK